jgi:hypothetical protein
MDVKQHGIYLLSDTYFAKYDTGKMMDNKRENSPHYVAIEIDSVLWMIPISSKVEKYQEKIEKAEKNGKKCLFYHVGRFAGKNCAFLIGDMIPVTEQYIAREYTISGIPYVIREEALNRKLVQKAKRYLLLVRQGRIKPYVDILAIERSLAE